MRWTLCLLLLLIGGCSGSGTPTVGTEELKKEMTSVFSALEMYALDHQQVYPENLAELTPKYLDKVPNDPVGGQPLGYAKIEDGFLLSASGAYGGEKGFPQMNHHGFWALKAADFPPEEAL